jgi:small-conductance mechanosensitive channel
MPLLDAHVFDITRVIQLAVAPVFLLSAVAGIINALLGRLARAVDRRRTVEDLLPAYEGDTRADMVVELGLLERRIGLVLWSIALAVLCCLLVCLLIGTAFLGAYAALDLSRTVAILFIAAVTALTGCLLLFMREVFMAALSEQQVRAGRGA